MPELLKTVGYRDGYVIIDIEGNSYKAVEQDGKWYLDGEEFKTLREAKQAVVEMEVASQDCSRESIDTLEERTSDVDAVLMDCVPPADLLVLVWNGSMFDREDLVGEVVRSLDEFGRLNEDGTLDVEYATRSFNKSRKRAPDEQVASDVGSERPGEPDREPGTREACT